MSAGYRIAVVGATGVVGQKVLQVLAERQFPVSELVPFASEHSVGKPVRFCDEELRCRALAPEAIGGFDLVFSSAGGDVSEEWMPRFADQGAIVIDKSSHYRMEPKVPLVVPEVNPEALTGVGPGRIISSPNCSTTQMVVALKPLHEAAGGIRRLVIATYQAVSGTGRRAVDELRAQSRAVIGNEPIAPPQAYPHQIAFNVLPQAGNFARNSDETDEECKLRQETRKIFLNKGGGEIQISATCVRVPVENCHSEAVNVELHEPLAPERARELLDAAPGVKVIDDPAAARYPLAIDATDRDEVFVGRIRSDPDNACTLDLWIVADNLRKGAATNAVQIAQLLHKQGQITPSSARLVAA